MSYKATTESERDYNGGGSENVSGICGDWRGSITVWLCSNAYGWTITFTACVAGSIVLVHDRTPKVTDKKVVVFVDT